MGLKDPIVYYLYIMVLIHCPGLHSPLSPSSVQHACCCCWLLLFMSNVMPTGYCSNNKPSLSISTKLSLSIFFLCLHKYTVYTVHCTGYTHMVTPYAWVSFFLPCPGDSMCQLQLYAGISFRKGAQAELCKCGQEGRNVLSSRQR